MDGHQLAERFLRLVSLYDEAEGRPASYGGAGPLSRAEVHSIEAIGNHAGISITLLAQVQGRSKSAVSQMIARLKAKDLVIQAKVPGSDRDTELSLTAKGSVAYREHEAGHADLYAELGEWADGIGEDAALRVAGLFDRLESYLRRYAEKEG
jgi:DNA-binding MarR family transcriptional regulator